MTKPNIANDTAVAGAHPGTKTEAEIRSNILNLANSYGPYYNEVDNADPRQAGSELNDLGKKALQVIRAGEWRTSTFSDTNTSPKYAVGSAYHYLGNGTICAGDDGIFTFSDRSNEQSRPVLSINKQNSAFTSDSEKTTLGTLDIDTVDGYKLNPLSPVYPSTNYSPTKPWNRMLLPDLFSNTTYLKGLAIEAVVGALLILIDKSLDKTSENANRKQNSKDMAVIIQDNQEIENQLFEQDNRI